MDGQLKFRVFQTQVHQYLLLHYVVFVTMFPVSILADKIYKYMVERNEEAWNLYQHRNNPTNYPINVLYLKFEMDH